MSTSKHNRIFSLDRFIYKEPGLVIKKGHPKRIECGETNNYSLFRDFFANRVKNIKRAGVIAKDMEKYGNFSTVNCVRDTNGGLLVWDGQHVLEASKKSKMHVNYDVWSCIPDDILILKNKYTKQWTLADFHRHGLAKGFEDSIAVDKFMKRSKRRLGRTIQLTASLRLLGNKYSNNDYKARTFNIAINNPANKILRYLEDYTEYISFNADSKFVTSLFLVEGTGLYEHKVMLKQLPKASRKLHNQLKIRDVVKGIQECYNYGRRTKVDFMLACKFTKTL